MYLVRKLKETAKSALMGIWVWHHHAYIMRHSFVSNRIFFTKIHFYQFSQNMYLPSTGVSHISVKSTEHDEVMVTTDNIPGTYNRDLSRLPIGFQREFPRSIIGYTLYVEQNSTNLIFIPVSCWNLLNSIISCVVIENHEKSHL